MGLVMNRFGIGGLADLENGALVVRRTTVTIWWVLNCWRSGPPGAVKAVVEEALLDANQQVIGEHAQKDMGLGAAFELMTDRRFHQRLLRARHPASRRGVNCRCARISSALRSRRSVFEQPGVVEVLGAGFADAVLLLDQLRLFGVIFDLVVKLTLANRKGESLWKTIKKRQSRS
jgi:hypothetical protein